MTDVDADGRVVALRDGRRVLVRAVRPEDRPLFERGFARLSEESRYRRFHGFKPALSERELAFFTRVDHADHEAVGAIDVESGEGVGVARYLRGREDPETAEAAVVVVDEWQGRGLGTIMLEALAVRARAAGIKRFAASLLADNRAMLRAFQRLGEVRASHRMGDLELDVALPVGAGRDLAAALRAAAAGDVRPTEAPGGPRARG